MCIRDRHTDDDLKKLIDMALSRDRLLQNKNIKINDDARNTLVKYSNGDCRALLNALEIAIFSQEDKEGDVYKRQILNSFGCFFIENFYFGNSNHFF